MSLPRRPVEYVVKVDSTNAQRAIDAALKQARRLAWETAAAQQQRSEKQRSEDRVDRSIAGTTWEEAPGE